MVDWTRVEKLRARGLSWEEIARDERVHFSPPEGVADPGRALKSTYFARRSRAKPTPAPSTEVKTRRGGRHRLPLRDWVPLVGIAVLLAGAVWALIVYADPLAGILVGGIVPGILILVLVGAGLVAVNFVFRIGRFSRVWKPAVALGITCVMVLAGVSLIEATAAGVCGVSSSTSSEPSGWEKASNSICMSHGSPVVFFMGSIACPFCSASSWAIRGALEAFGALSGWSYGTSNPNDVYSDTPEVELDSSTFSGPLAWEPEEGSDDTQITEPSLSLQQSEWQSTYDSGGSIPFLVVGGVFVHTGTLVDPGCLGSEGCGAAENDYPGQAYSPQKVSQDLSSGSGPEVAPIEQAQHWLEAFFWKALVVAGLGSLVPASVVNDQNVAACYAQIT